MYEHKNMWVGVDSALSGSGSSPCNFIDMEISYRTMIRKSLGVENLGNAVRVDISGSHQNDRSDLYSPQDEMTNTDLYQNEL